MEVPDRKPMFDAYRVYRGGSLKDPDVKALDAFLDGQDALNSPPPAPTTGPAVSDLTLRCVLYLASKEGIVLECYKDSEGIWTAFLGVTNASGHTVHPRYKDNPQPLEYAVQISVWLMRSKYMKDVLEAFAGFPLNEAQLAAATSFHYNTGAIKKTDWVKMVKAGDRASARTFLETHYLNGGDLKSRRMSEAALFFDGKWPSSMLVPQYPVNKPSYAPAWSKAVSLDLTEAVKKALAA